MTKKLIAIRASEYTRLQIEQLRKRTGLNQTEVIAHAIERWHLQETNERQPGRPAEREFEMRNKAEQRVDSTPELEPYRDTIMYDWPEGDEHWQWVATTPVQEIVDWAETVEIA